MHSVSVRVQKVDHINTHTHIHIRPTKPCHLSHTLSSLILMVRSCLFQTKNYNYSHRSSCLESFFLHADVGGGQVPPSGSLVDRGCWWRCPVRPTHARRGQWTLGGTCLHHAPSWRDRETPAPVQRFCNKTVHRFKAMAIYLAQCYSQKHFRKQTPKLVTSFHHLSIGEWMTSPLPRRLTVSVQVAAQDTSEAEVP